MRDIYETVKKAQMAPVRGRVKAMMAQPRAIPQARKIARQTTGFKQGGAFLPLRGGVTTAKAFRGKEGFKESQALQKKILGTTKDTGLHKGSKRKEGSKKAMGIARPHMTKSDHALKQAIKQVKKMPDKKFTSVNLEKVKVTSDRTGKSFYVNKTDPVKGSKGKKNYIQMMKYYHHRNQPKGKK